MPKDEDYKILVVDQNTLMYEGMQLELIQEKAKKELNNNRAIDEKSDSIREKYQLFAQIFHSYYFL